jgi:hypothetical protein
MSGLYGLTPDHVSADGGWQLRLFLVLINGGGAP